MRRLLAGLAVFLLAGVLEAQVTQTAALKQASKTPQTTKEFFVAGHEAWDRGDELGVVEYFTRASQMATKDTDKAIALNMIGYFYLTHHNLNKAKEYLEQAVGYDKTNKKPIYRARIWNNLGQVYEYQKDFAKALSCYKKACQAEPSYEKPQINREHLEGLMQTMALPSRTTPQAKATGLK